MKNLKNILITGKNSYIGTSLENWLLREPDKYYVDTVSTRDDAWKKKDFSEFDVVFHVAGIAHIKETKENQALYYKVNRDLVFEIAKKAKADGVKQFIFLSSMSVYGIENGVIDKNTPVKPNSAYGKSKIEAEELIDKLQDDLFTVATLRPPMVYGKGCRGNYQTLRKFALKSPIFPSFKNERSMIYVGNLTAFVKGLIDDQKSGLFFPQDAEYICTSDMVKKIAEHNGKKIKTIGIFNWAISFMLGLRVGILKKVFGSLTYEKVDLVTENSFEEAIKMTER